MYITILYYIIHYTHIAYDFFVWTISNSYEITLATRNNSNNHNSWCNDLLRLRIYDNNNMIHLLHISTSYFMRFEDNNYYYYIRTNRELAVRKRKTKRRNTYYYNLGSILSFPVIVIGTYIRGECLLLLLSMTFSFRSIFLE